MSSLGNSLDTRVIPSVIRACLNSIRPVVSGCHPGPAVRLHDSELHFVPVLVSHPAVLSFLLDRVIYIFKNYLFVKVPQRCTFFFFFFFSSNKVANRCGPEQAHSCNSGTWEWSVLRWCDPLRHKQQSSHACQEPIIVAIFYGKLLHFSRILHNLFMHKKILLSGYWCRIHFPYRVSRTRLRGAWTGWDSPCTRSHTHRTV